jgi:hypothetical protein
MRKELRRRSSISDDDFNPRFYVSIFVGVIFGLGFLVYNINGSDARSRFVQETT